MCFGYLQTTAGIQRTNHVRWNFDWRRVLINLNFGFISRSHVTIQVDSICSQIESIGATRVARHNQTTLKRRVIQHKHQLRK